MQSDAMTRILLASILLCLLILIVQGLTGERGSAAGRYSVTGMRAGGPILVRADSVTGRTWKLELGHADARWVEFGDAEPGAASAPLDQPDQERANPVGGNQPLQ